ncbi:hypothetical protein BH23CYA1_BH23CYA1_08850 [soil metagenome]
MPDRSILMISLLTAGLASLADYPVDYPVDMAA